MVSATADVCESEGRAQRKFTLERNIPVPSDWRFQAFDERSDGQWRSYAGVQCYAGIVHHRGETACDRRHSYERLEGRIAAWEDIVEQAHAGGELPRSRAQHGLRIELEGYTQARLNSGRDVHVAIVEVWSKQRRARAASAGSRVWFGSNHSMSGCRAWELAEAGNDDSVV